LFCSGRRALVEAAFQTEIRLGGQITLAPRAEHEASQIDWTGLLHCNRSRIVSLTWNPGSEVYAWPRILLHFRPATCCWRHSSGREWPVLGLD